MNRFIVLLRHGIAEDRTADKDDADRELTETGKRRMKQIARTLARVFPEAEALYSSPLIRAVQTSEAVEKAFGGELTTKTTDVLKPEANTEDFRRFLSDFKSEFAIFVGHEPNLTRLMLDLAGLPAQSRLELKKGGCYGIRLEGQSGQLEWMVPPRILRSRE